MGIMADGYAAMGYGERRVEFGRRPAVVVVDLQRGFTERRFALGGSPLVERAVRNTALVLAAARAKGVPVASCRMAYHGRADMPHWKIAKMYDGEFFFGHEAVEIDPRVLDASYDVVVAKTGPSIFFATPVAAYFTRRGVDTVIVTGCNTSGCIRASVVDSFSHGWRTIVPEDCVGDVERAPHDANLLDIGRRYADIVTANAVIAYLEGLGDGAADPGPARS